MRVLFSGGATGVQKTILRSFVQTLNEQIQDAPDALRKQLLCRARDTGIAAFMQSNLYIRGSGGRMS